MMMMNDEREDVAALRLAADDIIITVPGIIPGTAGISIPVTTVPVLVYYRRG